MSTISINENTVKKIPIGTEIFICTGPGHSPYKDGCAAWGKVLQKVETRWGYHLVVEIRGGLLCGYDDDEECGFTAYSTETVNTLNSLDHKGIGAYADLEALGL